MWTLLFKSLLDFIFNVFTLCFSNMFHTSNANTFVCVYCCIFLFHRFFFFFFFCKPLTWTILDALLKWVWRIFKVCKVDRSQVYMRRQTLGAYVSYFEKRVQTIIIISLPKMLWKYMQIFRLSRGTTLLKCIRDKPWIFTK